MKKAFFFLLSMIGINIGSACSQPNYKNTDVQEFADLIKNQDVQLVDVRTSTEFAEGHIEGAINIDVKDDAFEQKVMEKLDKKQPVAVYCRSGRRSANAADILTRSGFTVTNLKGGIIAWEKAGRPTTTISAEMDIFKTQSGKQLRIFPLMHASIRISVGSTEIIVDPVSKLRDRTLDFTKLPKADFILVTHEHADHFDKQAIATLTKQDTKLIANKRCADILGQGQAMSNGDKASLTQEISIEAVPAYNVSPGRTQFHPKGRDNGYVLDIDGTRIYIAGDTEDIPEMEQLKDIDIAFLPCNQPFTMTAEQFTKAVRIVKPRVTFPYHYDNEAMKQAAEMLKSEGYDVRCRNFE